jgi:hypothetical protein
LFVSFLENALLFRISFLVSIVGAALKKQANAFGWRK